MDSKWVGLRTGELILPDLHGLFFCPPVSLSRILNHTFAPPDSALAQVPRRLAALLERISLCRESLPPLIAPGFRGLRTFPEGTQLSARTRTSWPTIFPPPARAIHFLPRSRPAAALASPSFISAAGRQTRLGNCGRGDPMPRARPRPRQVPAPRLGRLGQGARAGLLPLAPPRPRSPPTLGWGPRPRSSRPSSSHSHTCAPFPRPVPPQSGLGVSRGRALPGPDAQAQPPARQRLRHGGRDSSVLLQWPRPGRRTGAGFGPCWGRRRVFARSHWASRVSRPLRGGPGPLAWSQLLCPGPCLRSPPHPQSPHCLAQPADLGALLAASLRRAGDRVRCWRLLLLALNRSSPPPHFPGVHLPLIPGQDPPSWPPPQPAVAKPSSLRRRTSCKGAAQG